MRCLFAIVMLSFSFAASAKKAELFSPNGLFLKGFDPVSYNQDKKAVKGNQEWSYSYRGSKVLFSSEENKQKFIENPEAFVPAYNGYCAYAMANDGSLVEVDPTAFKIIEGKTYLFYDGLWADTLKKWNKNPDAPQVEKADKNWRAKHI